MHLYYKNVNDAFVGIVEGFMTGKFVGSSLYGGGKQFLQPPINRTTSRYGSVLVIEEPVTITYTEPTQRLLFNAERNCNPFFHLIEALWMLSGYANIRPLLHFNKKVAEFADSDLREEHMPRNGNKRHVSTGTEGNLWWGAYGYRWRNWFRHDQLETAIEILKEQPQTRRLVLQMWEPADLQRVLENPSCKDVPCNTEVMLLPRNSLQTERLLESQHSRGGQRRHALDGGDNSDENANTVRTLDMTVINRSNDMLWGALGSNYVHFSFLLEYIALAAGFAIGRYHQVTNNLHVYVSPPTGDYTPRQSKEDVWSGKWNPNDLLAANGTEDYGNSYDHITPLFIAPYQQLERCQSTRIDFDHDCQRYFEDGWWLKSSGFSQMLAGSFAGPWCPFFEDLVIPATMAWNYHKARDYTLAQRTAGSIRPADWRLACQQWLARTEKKWCAKAMVRDSLPNIQ